MGRVSGGSAPAACVSCDNSVDSENSSYRAVTAD